MDDPKGDAMGGHSSITFDHKFKIKKSLITRLSLGVPKAHYNNDLFNETSYDPYTYFLILWRSETFPGKCLT